LIAVISSYPIFHSYNTGHHAVNLLFQTGTYDIFNAPSLAIFFVVYFTLAAVTAGASFPSGLVIPMLTMGTSLR
jgi:H+/Cl- antiporter ClcA